MKIYEYWAQSGGRAGTPDGKSWWLVKWGGSNVSVRDAEDVAKVNFKASQEKLARDGLSDTSYYVSASPLRETVIERFGEFSQPYAAITRNRYGALVLNTPSVFIADVDANIDHESLHKTAQLNTPDFACQNSRQPGIFNRLLRIGKSRKLSKQLLEATQIELRRLEHSEIVKVKERLLLELREFHKQNPSVSFRVYETAAGFRIIVTNQTMDATSETSSKLLEAFNSDKLYRRLCNQQECYRARLTPKPWRLPKLISPQVFPNSQNMAAKSLQNWLKDYEEKSSKFAVCKLVESYGHESVDGEVASVLAIHDSYVLHETIDQLA